MLISLRKNSDPFDLLAMIRMGEPDSRMFEPDSPQVCSPPRSALCNPEPN